MLYHQLSLIYSRKYDGIIHRKQPRYVGKLPDETDDPKSLLSSALDSIDKAIKLCESVIFRLDRASLLETMRNTKGAKREYDKLTTMVHPDKPEDNVQIFVRFGLFLHNNGKVNEADDRLKRGIQIAIEECSDIADSNKPRFQGRVLYHVKEAAHKLQHCNQDDQLGQRENNNLRWLQQRILGKDGVPLPMKT